jgi:hypothetical protein
VRRAACRFPHGTVFDGSSGKKGDLGVSATQRESFDGLESSMGFL